MPQVVNGCGTWYYGKKNLQQYQGVCNSCKNATTLSSYDTRLYVVIVFVPIIPLGRKRIIDECAACSRHGVMPLADWQRAQHRSEQTLEDYRRSPRDPKLAEEAVGACVSFRDLAGFFGLAPEIEKHLSGDAKTICMLAAVYDLFGRIDEAERLFRVALAAKDEHEIREGLADCLMRQGRPEEAEPYLEHIVREGIPDRVDALYQLAQGYQLKGDHEKALAVFDQCETVNPLILKDATFQRLRDTSARHQGTHTVVKPSEVERKARSAQARRRFVKVAPMVVALAALAYLAVAWIQAARREVHLANGLDRAYTVRLNGASHTLPPHSVTPIRLEEGDVEVEIADSPIPPETVSITTSMLTRPFANHTFVLNPDRAAVLQQMKLFYVPRNQGQREPEVSFTTGRTLHHFRGVDFPFQTPPESIKTKSHGGTTRQALALVGKEAQMPGHFVLLSLGRQLGEDLVTQAAQRHLLLEPEHDEYLLVLGRTMKPPELAAFLRPRLADRPLKVQWHRAYLNVMDKTGEDQQALREYEAMLAAEPQNKDLMYLVGRICRDQDRSLALCQKGASGESPSGYAVYSLCSYHLANGQFHEAAQQAERVRQLLPGKDDVRWYSREALLADQQFDKLLGLLREERNQPMPLGIAARVEECYVLAVRGRKDEAQKAVEELRTEWGPSGQQQVQAVRAQLAYCQGNTAEFVKLLEPSPDADDRLAAHLAGGNLEAAEKDIQQCEPSAQMHLWLYLAAMRHKQKELADRQLQKAIELLKKDDFQARAFAQALEGKPPMPVGQLIRLREMPREKVLLLTALGLHDPSAREACFALARKLNYDRRFPHLLLKDLLDAPPVR